MIGSLSVRERLLVKGIVEGQSVFDSALNAGYPISTAGSYPYTVLQKPEVKQNLEEMMEKAGIGTMTLFKVHADMLQATKPISAVVGKDASTSTMDFIEVPDWTARGSALNMGYKLKGLYADTSVTVNVESHEARMQRLTNKTIEAGSGE